MKTQCYIMQMSNYKFIVLIKNSKHRFNMMTSNMHSFTSIFSLFLEKHARSSFSKYALI